MVPLFVRKAYPPFMIKGSGPTIGRRPHTSQCEGANAKCSASHPLDLPNASSQSNPPSKTSSPSNAISSRAASSSNSGWLHLRCGGNVLRQPDRHNGCQPLVPIELTCQCLYKHFRMTAFDVWRSCAHLHERIHVSIFSNLSNLTCQRRRRCWQ